MTTPAADTVRPELLRYTLGLKVRSLRRQLGHGLKDVAARSRMSVSYLSEIEKGLKYPKPDKILALAAALGVDFDDLVSLKVDDDLDPLKSLASSPLVQGFPFELFGLQAQDLLSLVTDVPDKAGALVQALLDIGRTYDVRVEHFLFAALRSYQQMYRNHFPEIEAAALAFRRDHGLEGRRGIRVGAERLRRVLEERWGCRVDESRIPADPALAGLRSIWVEGGSPDLLVNGRLRPEQKAFLYGRELGYRVLGLEERSASSSPVAAVSFDQAINDFQAAYFAGAVLIPESDLAAQAERFLARKRWSPAAFAELLARYQATPETLFYRLSQVLPGRLGLRRLFFLRFSHGRTADDGGGGAFRLTKYLNMSPVPVPYGIGLNERYCRRWSGLSSLTALARGTADSGGTAGRPAVVAQRARFRGEGVGARDGHGTYFVISVARPLTLAPGVDASVSLGFPLDELRRHAAFADDPAVPSCEVGLTCERCPIADCAERAAPAELVAREAARAARAEALAALVTEVRAGGRGTGG